MAPLAVAAEMSQLWAQMVKESHEGQARSEQESGQADSQGTSTGVCPEAVSDSGATSDDVMGAAWACHFQVFVADLAVILDYCQQQHQQQVQVQGGDEQGSEHEHAASSANLLSSTIAFVLRFCISTGQHATAQWIRDLIQAATSVVDVSGEVADPVGVADLDQANTDSGVDLAGAQVDMGAGASAAVRKAEADVDGTVDSTGALDKATLQSSRTREAQQAATVVPGPGVGAGVVGVAGEIGGAACETRGAEGPPAQGEASKGEASKPTNLDGCTPAGMSNTAKDAMNTSNMIGSSATEPAAAISWARMLVRGFPDPSTERNYLSWHNQQLMVRHAMAAGVLCMLGLSMLTWTWLVEGKARQGWALPGHRWEYWQE